VVRGAGAALSGVFQLESAWPSAQKNYARSTKEGQYYLMPLFLLTMPLIFLTLGAGGAV